MSLLDLMSLAGSLAVASVAVATFAIVGRAFWRSRRTAHSATRFSPSESARVVQPTIVVGTGGTHFASASGVR
jgi:hypothetical protein